MMALMCLTSYCAPMKRERLFFSAALAFPILLDYPVLKILLKKFISTTIPGVK